jgi:hypothetical protein
MIRATFGVNAIFRITMWDSKRKHLVVAAAVTVLVLTFNRPIHHQSTTPAIPAQCLAFRASLEPTPDFIASRAAHGSDRFVEGTSPVLIRNAKILTGARNGTEVVFGDVLLDKGVILGVGYIPRALLRPNLQVIDAEGKWISPGIVDSHSHLGVYSAPALEGVCSAIEFSLYCNGRVISVQAHRTETPSRRRFYLGYAVLMG